MADPYRSADFLPAGTVIDGWGGTAARDHNHLGLFTEGPQPARSPWVRLLGVQTSDETPLPPTVAQVLTRAALIRMTRTRTTIRQALSVPVHKEASAIARRLRPLVLGKRRFGVQG